jgi:hypothetical protein
MDGNALNPEHAHEFDARLLILEGAMTIAAEGQERTYRTGDIFTMAAGCQHAEQAGPRVLATWRDWLNTHKITPTLFRHSVNIDTIIRHVTFQSEDEAAAFAVAFDGRVVSIDSRRAS